MDAPPMAPPVVAVIVTSAPDDWFDEALAAFGAQDYPNLSVLVLDAGDDDCTARVANVLPAAYVRRLPPDSGLGAAANQVFHLVKDAAYLVFCHDDVAPEPDAVRLMVEEALRSNAGVVGPKLVDWFDPERLLSVGFATDKTGQASPLVERHELDQEQYDAVRDVFAVSGACLLVRSDLFTSLEGFDAVMDGYGEDVDLCWRAQIAGARVLVAPAARVRHLEDGVDRTLGPSRDREGRLQLEARNRLRAVLKNYGAFHLVRVLPQAAVLAICEAVVAVASGQWARARAVAGAWPWNLGRLGDVLRRRRAVRRLRLVPDSDVRRLQVRGSARLTAYVRGQMSTGDGVNPLLAGVRDGRAFLRTRAGIVSVALLAFGVLVLLVGSRHLLSGNIAAVGQLAHLPGMGPLLRGYVSGWRTTGMGAAGPAPPALGLLGLAGAVFLGDTSLLRRVLIVGAWPAALIGVWRLTRPVGSTRARLVAVAVAAAIPLPYDALARGRWEGLVAYAAIPWLLTPLLQATGLEPFGTKGRALARPMASMIVGVGIGVALAGSLAPEVVWAVVVVAIALAVGSLLTERAGSAALRPVAVGAGGLGVAAVLLLPWVAVLIAGHQWTPIGGVASPASRAFGLGALARFETGPLGAPPIGWAFVVAAALPLLIGQGWRLAWAVRFWIVFLFCLLAAWAGGLGWLPTALRAPEVLLAPAAMSLAAATGLGVMAFDVDLPSYRFGWRQLASFAAAAAVFLGSVQIVAAVGDGAWHLPANDPGRDLAWMRSERAAGTFRVLWLGDGDVLPLNGWRLGGGGQAGDLAYATSRDGALDATDLWVGPSNRPTRLLADQVNLARGGRTTQLGHLLAPLAVRYLVVAQRAVPGRSDAPAAPVPATLIASLDAQLDLRQLPSDPALLVYENTAWGPGRAEIPAASGTVPADLGRGADLSGAQPVLGSRSPIAGSGPVTGPSTVLLSESSSPQWRLRVAGTDTARAQAFGAVNAFAVDSGGRARLRFRTPPWYQAVLVLQVVVWAVAVRAAVRLRRRRRHLAVTSPAAAEPMARVPRRATVRG